MVERRKSNKREQELIDATLECIANEGLQAATVRKVAEYAGVTNGLIRFYFDSKDEMIRKAYEKLLDSIYKAGLDATVGEGLSPTERMCRFIEATLSPPVTSSRTVMLWATFLPLTRIDPEMARIRYAGYADTTDMIEPLVAAVLTDVGKSVSSEERRRYAVMINALIDGLWIEGGHSGEKYSQGVLANMAIDGASALIGVDLRRR